MRLLTRSRWGNRAGQGSVTDGAGLRSADPTPRQLAARATKSKAWGEAETLWRGLYDMDDGDREALLGLVSALQGLGRLEAAEDIFRNARSEHAGHADYAVSFALNAQLRSDLDGAIARSVLIVRNFPELPLGYGFASMLLTAASRGDEACELLAEGTGRFPDDDTLILPSIHVAVARRDWRTAASGLDRLSEKFPSDHAARVDAERFRAAITAGHAELLRQQASDSEAERAFLPALEAWRTHRSVTGPTRDNQLGIGRCSREVGEFTEAETAFGEAAMIAGPDPEIEANLAQVPAMAGDWQEAARRWREVVKQFPELTALVSMAAPALARAGKADEAEDMILGALQRDPGLIDLWVAHAIVAQVAGCWEAAVERWAAVIERAPDVLGFKILQDEARKNIQAKTSRYREVQLDEDCEMPPMREMVKQFESLGDNCEFGVAQRHFDAEPITLFRFAAIEPEKMIELLELDLEPLGDPAHTLVYEMMDEFYIKDDRGYYYMHTFVKTNQVDPERYVRQQVPRISYLKRNFLANMASGDRIYVCKQSGTQITDDTLSRLSKCLRKHGDNVLLGGRLADEHHPLGLVEQIDENIFVGYTTRLHGDEDRALNVQSWGTVLKKVYQARQRQLERASTKMTD